MNVDIEIEKVLKIVDKLHTADECWIETETESLDAIKNLNNAIKRGD